MTEIDCKWNLTFQGLNIKPAKLFKENKLHFTFSSAIKFAARVVWEDVAHDLQTTKYHLQLLIINDNKFTTQKFVSTIKVGYKKENVRVSKIIIANILTSFLLINAGWIKCYWLSNSLIFEMYSFFSIQNKND